MNDLAVSASTSPAGGGSHGGVLAGIVLALMAAAGMAFVHPWLGPVLAVALGGAVFVVSRPLRGLMLFCVLAPALPWMKVGAPLPVPEALLALTWVGVFFQWLGGRLPAWPDGPTERAMRRFMLWSIVPLVAGQFIAEGEGNGPINWVRWLLNLSPVFLVPLLVRDTRTRDRLLLSLLLGFALLLLISLGFFVRGRDARLMIPFLAALHYPYPEAIQDIFSADYTRMASPWVHPNSTGGALLLAAPLGLFYGVMHRGWRRALGFFIFVGSAAGIVFCGSRGALLCLGLFVVWLAWRRTPYALRGLIAAVLLAITFLAVYPPAQQRFASLFSGKDVSTGVRFDEYAHFPQNAWRHPLGLGFKAETPASSPEKGIYGISNLWLNYWFKLGLPGMLLFIAVTVAWWREVRLRAPFTQIGAHNAMRIATTGTVLAALATGFIDHYFSFTQVLIALFWLILALGLLEARMQPVAAARPDAPPRP
ncbi:MAG: O-antigen ligase family protein [Aquabacterium sp.]